MYLHSIFHAVQFIKSPLCDIVFNIGGNLVQFIGVAHNAVMEPGLPGKRNGVFTGVFGDSGFETRNDVRQTTAMIGNGLHGLVFVRQCRDVIAWRLRV